MTQEKLNRGLRTPVHQHSNSTPITMNLPKPDITQFAGRIRCYNCRKVVNFSRNYPKKRAQASGCDAGVRAVSCDLEQTATADVLSAHESHLKKLVKEERWWRLSLEQQEADESDHSDAKVLGACHRPCWCSTRHGLCEDTDWTECSKTCGSQWEGATLAFERAPVFSTRHSQRAVELEWDVGEKIIRFLAHVAPGNSGLLSRSDLKALGATINPTNNRLHLENPRTTLNSPRLPTDYYEIDLLNRNSEVEIVGSHVWRYLGTP